MPESEKDDVQRVLLKQMIRRRRRAFKGPLALRLTIGTSHKTPAHSHTTAKNLLDLFGKPRPTLATRRRALLYHDDRQIHGLSVTCHHGEATPTIRVDARPMRDLLTDLGIVYELPADGDGSLNDHWSEFDMAFEQWGDFRRDEVEWRARLGDEEYEYLARYHRARAQEQLLGRAALEPVHLARMYDVNGLGPNVLRIWDELFAQSPFKIRLGELPQTVGSSAQYEADIRTSLTAFQTRLGPLLVPIALEVIVKPPPPSRQMVVHDLDNVVRDYLIPNVLDIFKPASDYAFTLDDDARKSLARLARGNKQIPLPPLSTSVGVTRYEAWRLPPANEGSEGYVQMALVNDLTGYGELFGQIDTIVDRWSDKLE
jgi:hypothetical protein